MSGNPTAMRLASAAYLLLLAVPVMMRDSQQNMLQRCQRQRITAPSTERDTLPGGEGIVYFRNGLNVDCPVENRRLRADSARQYLQQQRLELFGNVSFHERGTEMLAQRMIYTRRDDRVEAYIDVRAQMANGSSAEGYHMMYYARNPELRRDKELLISEDRAKFTLVERDSVAKTADSTILLSNKARLDGDDVYAYGNVEIRRTELDAKADSLYASRGTEKRTLRLMKNPSLTGKGDNQFTMNANIIDVDAGKNRQLERVLARGTAHVKNSDLDLTSDTIDMRMADKKFTDTKAWGDSARMVSGRFTIRGNRLDIAMPGGNVDRIKSSGKALALIKPDSAQIKTDQDDYIRADTVIITFEQFIKPPERVSRDSVLAGADPFTKPDTSQVPKSIVATGTASMYIQRASPKTPECPTVDRWSGDKIDASMRNREITGLKVEGSPESPVAGFRSDCGQTEGRGLRGRGGRAGGGAIDTTFGRGRGGRADTLTMSRR